MRSIIVPFLFCLTLWAVALPQDSAPTRVSVSQPASANGGLLTVTVNGAPGTTKAAFFDLSPEIHGLQLFPKGNGVWQGSFALLPSMAGQKFQPTPHLYDAGRKEIPVQGSGASVKVASSSSGQPGMLAALPDGRTAVAFDDKIRLDTIEVRSRDGAATVTPELKNNYILLPKSVDRGDIVSVSALNLQGSRVVLMGPASSSMAMGGRGR